MSDCSNIIIVVSDMIELETVMVVYLTSVYLYYLRRNVYTCGSRIRDLQYSVTSIPLVVSFPMIRKQCIIQSIIQIMLA